MKILPTTDDVLNQLAPVIEAERWGPRHVRKLARERGIRIQPFKRLRERFDGEHHMRSGRAYLLGSGKWHACTQAVRGKPVRSLREAQAVLYRSNLPHSEHIAREALHAAGVDGLPQTLLPKLIETLVVEKPEPAHA